MELAKFRNILKSMKAREEWKSQVYELGIDLFNVPNDPYEWVIELFNEIYPHSVGDIEYFCWELNFGERFTPGCVIDEEGRECNFSSIETLWLYLESREKEAGKI
jgi:hypothetical protein